MLKTCLKCQHSAEVADDPAAECPNCGAIFAKVEAVHDREKLEARLGVQRASRKLQETVSRGARNEAIATKQPKWITPQIAKLVFALWATLLLIPAFIMLALSPSSTTIIALVVSVLLSIAGAVAIECVLVMFHIASSLDECKQSLRVLALSTKTN